MRHILACLVLAGACGGARPAPTAPASAKLDEAAVIAKSHAFFDALDRNDREVVLAPLGAAFVGFADGRFADRAAFAKRIQIKQ